MPYGDIETYYEDGLWKIKTEGSKAIAWTFETEQEAVSAGRQMARERLVEHIIRQSDGTIDDSGSHAYEPDRRCG